MDIASAASSEGVRIPSPRGSFDEAMLCFSQKILANVTLGNVSNAMIGAGLWREQTSVSWLLTMGDQFLGMCGRLRGLDSPREVCVS